MPPLPSVTSACEGPRLWTLRYSSVLLPKSFERPGPKSVSPAMYCSGVKAVVWCMWIVDMCCPFRFPEISEILGLVAPVDTAHTGFLHLGGHDLLSAGEPSCSHYGVG